MSHLNLDEIVSSALLERGGQLGPLLTLTEKVEVTDFEAVTPLLEKFGLNYDDMLDAQLDAFNWRSTIMVT